MALLASRMVIPLERISYVTTPTLTKKDLVQWTHISGRPDLSIAFEKEPCISRSGYPDKQTLMKVKEGMTLVDTLVLEDFVCQALVAERHAILSPASPRSFAIFINSPDLAFRYQLVTGEFRKVQLLFRDEAGFESAVGILKQFNLPLTERSAKSKRGRNASLNAPSVSESTSQRPSTIFSKAQGSAMSATESTWFGSRGYNHFPIDQEAYGSAASLSPQKPSKFILPAGPSLAESMLSMSSIHSYSQPHLERTEMMNIDDPRYERQEIFSVPAHNAPLTTQALKHAIDFTEKGISSKIPPVEHGTRYKPSWLSRSSSVKDQIPPFKRNELLLSTQESTQSWTQNHLNYPPAISRDAMPALDTEEVLNKDLELGTVPIENPAQRSSNGKTLTTLSQQTETRKPTTRKRAAKKVFTTAATQTMQLDHTSRSMATQTNDLNAYLSKSIQTDSVTYALPSDVWNAQTRGKIISALVDLIRGRSVHCTPVETGVVRDSIYSELRDKTIGNALFLPLRKGAKINKFGRRGQIISPLRSQVLKTLSPMATSGLLVGNLYSQTPTQRRKINKFKTRAVMVSA